VMQPRLHHRRGLCRRHAPRQQVGPVLGAVEVAHPLVVRIQHDAVARPDAVGGQRQEHAAEPADESWRNINAIDNLTQTLIEATDRLIIAAMQGNAGAGGVFMALAADQVWARDGVVLNPHYKNMGNLYGSEYWTYLLPRRLKSMAPGGIMARRLPMSAAQAARSGLIDAVLGGSPQAFRAQVLQRAARLAAGADIPALLRAKRQQRERDEACKPLVAYRDEELARMRRNFYGFDPSYHVARSNFVQRVAPSWTPRHLAIHRNT
jgi:putative two-component system protein, hydrogenase maturation factor HypX/HoxX